MAIQVGGICGTKRASIGSCPSIKRYNGGKNVLTRGASATGGIGTSSAI